MRKLGDQRGHSLGFGVLCRWVKCGGRRRAATGWDDPADRMSAGDRVQNEPAPDVHSRGGLLEITTRLALYKPQFFLRIQNHDPRLIQAM